MLILNTIIDIFFIVDLVLNFFTTYIDPINGSEVVDHRTIISKYLKRDFWIDLAASIPTDAISGWTGTFGPAE